MPTFYTLDKKKFRYETTNPSQECEGVVVLSDNGKNILTSSVESYTKNDQSDADIGKSVPIDRKDKQHTNDLHCNNDPFHDIDHGHMSYKNSRDMMNALRNRFPKECSQILHHACKPHNNKEFGKRIYIENPEDHLKRVEWEEYLNDRSRINNKNACVIS